MEGFLEEVATELSPQNEKALVRQEQGRKHSLVVWIIQVIKSLNPMACIGNRETFCSHSKLKSGSGEKID